MNTRRRLALILILGLLAPAAAAAPLAGPCVPGAVYDPACDVDHDGDGDIFDVQLTAGHWNQTGTFVSDNNHTHLGQTWTGTNNPLKLTGAYGAPDYAPLVLSNSSGSGLLIGSSFGNGVRVNSTSSSGVYVDSAGSDGVHVVSADGTGVYVYSANEDGFFVCNTGSGFGCSPSSTNNGLEVGDAQDSGVLVSQAGVDGVAVSSANRDGLRVTSAHRDGLQVLSADGNGVQVFSTGEDGVHICSPGTAGACSPSTTNNGLEVGNAQDYGVRVNQAGADGVAVFSAGGDGVDVVAAAGNGVEAAGSNYAGYFEGNIYVGGSCTGCRLAAFAINAGDGPMQPGDMVAIDGTVASEFANAPALWRVVPVRPGLAAVGVVAGHAEVVVSQEEGKPVEARLVPRQGPAASGDYVSVVYHGPVRVAAAGNIQAGQRVTVDAGGVRALRLVEVDGVQVAEAAPSLGIALSEVEHGLLWVLVNPQ